MLILVRQRGSLFEQIIRALKEADIPVAGADRMVLTEHIAIMDLIALADALLLPEDDLALAAVLKSPLFGLTEEHLFDIAWNRGALSLRAALFGKANDYADAADRLNDARPTRPCAKARSRSMRGCSGPAEAASAFLARLGTGSQRRARRISQPRARL